MLKQFAFVLVFVFFLNMIAFADTANTRVQLPSPGLQLVSKANYIGPTKADEKISFTVWLKFRNKTQFDQLAHGIYDPNNSRFRHYMTKEEYLSQFAPTIDVKQNVQKYFISNGMKAEISYGIVHVTGSARQVARLFNVKFNNYKYENKIVYASTTPPTLPAAIAQYVQSITGLTNIPRFHSMHVQPAASLATATTTSFQGFGPTTLQTAYSFTGIAPVYGTKIDGTGQTIVIIGDGSNIYTPAQVMADANIYGGNGSMLPLLTSQNFIMLDQNLNPCTTQCIGSGGGGEQALDIQSSHTLAPGANIVACTSLANDVDIELQNVINALIINHFTIAGFSNAYVISNSWSGQEEANESLEPYLEAAMASGISVNFSSGDCGDNIHSQTRTCSGTLSVNYPPSSTYTTAVGGTSLFVDANWNYSFETGWGNTAYNTGLFDSGSSGGISQFYGPASWQKSIWNFTAGGYGKISSFNNRRSLPDIAMVGDNHTGLNIVLGGVRLLQDGGTSLACPLFSAVLTLVNQARALKAGGQNPIGQAAPSLYIYQNALANNNALHLIIPPHPIINGTGLPTAAGAPKSAFTLPDNGYGIFTFSWDSTLTIIENQFWNDVVGLGTPNVPNFVALMSGLP